jgi:hypothetical protein
MKGTSRKRKIELINNLNPQWRDLFEVLKDYQGEELIRLRKLLR